MTPRRRHHMVCEDVHNPARFHIRTRLLQLLPFCPVWNLISSFYMVPAALTAEANMARCCLALWRTVSQCPTYKDLEPHLCNPLLHGDVQQFMMCV